VKESARNRPFSETDLSTLWGHASPVNLATVRKMDRQTIRLPDIDPSIAQANASGTVPLTAALKSAGFSIGVLVFFIVMVVSWSQFTKPQRGQQIEISAAAPAPRF